MHAWRRGCHSCRGRNLGKRCRRMSWYREGRKMPSSEAGREAHCRRPRSLRRRRGEKGWSKTRIVESKTWGNWEGELCMCGGYVESICFPSQVMQCVGMRTLLALRRNPALSNKDFAKSVQNRRKHGSVCARSMSSMYCRVVGRRRRSGRSKSWM